MELKITEEKENALFNRKEIKGFIESEVVPSRAETLKILSEKFKIPWGNIKIKKIVGKFGSKTFSVEANIYSSKQDKDSIELKKKKEIELEKRVAESATQVQQEQPEAQPEVSEETTPPPTTPKAVNEKDSNVQQNIKSESQENPEPQDEANKQ